MICDFHHEYAVYYCMSYDVWDSIVLRDGVSNIIMLRVLIIISELEYYNTERDILFLHIITSLRYGDPLHPE